MPKNQTQNNHSNIVYMIERKSNNIESLNGYKTFLPLGKLFQGANKTRKCYLVIKNKTVIIY